MMQQIPWGLTARTNRSRISWCRNISAAAGVTRLWFQTSNIWKTVRIQFYCW